MHSPLDAPDMKKQIESWHHEYITSITPMDWAVSLEASLYMFDFVRINNPGTLADFGSGFSSVVLRLFSDKQVYSIDDDSSWLERTRSFLEQRNLPTRQLVLLNDFNIANLDFAFYDLGTDATRLENFSRCYESTRAGGYILIDDLHKPGWKEFFKANIKDSQFIELKGTLDRFGRYIGLVIKSRQG
jgi:hypothetical protein